jgi:hypothetical protein
MSGEMSDTASAMSACGVTYNLKMVSRREELCWAGGNYGVHEIVDPRFK